MVEFILFIFDCVNDFVCIFVNIYICCGDNRGIFFLVLNLKFLVKFVIKFRFLGKSDVVFSGVYKRYIIGGVRFI